MHRRRLLAAALAAAFAPRLFAREPVIGGPCQGCDLVFPGMPEMLAPHARLAPADEPGEPMTVRGTVRDGDDRPAPGIIIYAYQTDAGGNYPPADTAHGRLRAWAQTDEAGRYRFDTIRPGAYPGQRIPEHIHLHVIEPGLATYYLASIEFDDDPLLTERHRQRHASGRGGSGLVTPVRDEHGTWQVSRDIFLRRNVE